MKFRKKPVVIEAMQLDGENPYALVPWINDGIDPTANTVVRVDYKSLVIRTLEGDMRATHGDWIIKGVQGEFYPCKPDIFSATYEAV